MLHARKPAKGRRRTSFARMLRELGPRLHTAYRHARVALWRFKRSPEQRDGAAAIATFAFIGLFAVGSVDAVITGGADFGPSAAYANEYHSAPVVTAQAGLQAVIAEEPEQAIKTVAPEAVDYSFTTEVLLGGPEVVIGDEAILIDAALMELAPSL